MTAAAMPAGGAEYQLEPGQKAVGEPTRYTVKQDEVFADIARQFDLGYTEIVAANPGINPWVPGAGRTIEIPTRHVLPDGPRQGIVINLAQSRLFYFPPGGDQVETYPITIGFIGKNTPLGVTRVVNKEPNPTWYPPASIRAEEPELPAAVPPGPDNPLGDYAMHLGWKNYLIHGTNKPDSIGRTVSHGCIRLYPEDIQKLFGEVGVGTSVRTVEQPATAGWRGDALYVHVYPSKQQADEIDTSQAVTPDPAEGVDVIVRAAAGNYENLVDWTAVRRAAQERHAMAVKIADRSSGGQIASDEPAPPAYDSAPNRGPAYQGRVYEGSAYAPPPSQYTAPSRYSSGYDRPSYGAVQDYSAASPSLDPATQFYRAYGPAPDDDGYASQYDAPAPPLQMPPSHYIGGR